MPEIEVTGLDEGVLSIQKICDELNDVAKENLGMSMIFTLVSALQDIVAREVETKASNAEKKEQQQKELADRLERVKFEGNSAFYKAALVLRIL